MHPLVLPHQALYPLLLGHGNLLCVLQKQVPCFFLPCHIFFSDLHTTDTVPIYDGRKHQLKVPEELRNVPAILSRYPGKIPHHSLVLVAYTVSLYRAAQGSRKDQPTVPFNISFAVVLHDEPLNSDSEDNVQDGDTSEEDGNEVLDNQSDGIVKEAEDQNAEDVEENQSNVEVDLSDVAAEEVNK